MKQSTNKHSGIIDWILFAVGLALAIYLLVTQNLLLGISLSLVLLGALALLSRRGPRWLRNEYNELMAAMCQDRLYKVKKQQVILHLMMAMLPIYLMWLVASVLAAFAGFAFYFVVGVPSFVMLFVAGKAMIDLCDELGLPPWQFWLLQAGVWILTLIPFFIIGAFIWE